MAQTTSNSNWPRAVIFDFDGVITHSEPLHYAAFREALAAEGMELGEEEYYRETIGLDDSGAIRRLYEQRGRVIDQPTLTRVWSHKSAALMTLIRRGQYHLLPGVEQFVRALAPHMPLAICSASLRREIDAMLGGVGLTECFRVLVTNEDVAVPKPDPDGYLLAARRLSQVTGCDILPADCLVIEDAPKVIRNVKSVGFATLGVATTYPIQQLTEADWAVQNLHIREVRCAVPALRDVLYDTCDTCDAAAETA